MIEQPKDGPLVVLVGVDGSETSMRAGAYAAGLARRQGARLVILYVRTYMVVTSVTAATVPAMQEAHDQIERELRETIQTQAPRIGLTAELVVREGNPYAELVRLADEIHADAVVVGASTKAGHRFVGSLAVHLVRASRWPVTVVP